MASAVLLFAISLAGAGIGSLLVGTLNDAFEPRYGTDSIRASIAIVSLFNLWGTYHFLRAARSLREDLEAARLIS